MRSSYLYFIRHFGISSLCGCIIGDRKNDVRIGIVSRIGIRIQPIKGNVHHAAQVLPGDQYQRAWQCSGKGAVLQGGIQQGNLSNDWWAGQLIVFGTRQEQA